MVKSRWGISVFTIKFNFAIGLKFQYKNTEKKLKEHRKACCKK